jgi:hypothetical protein
MVAYLPADLSKKGLYSSQCSGEFTVVPNSPPEVWTVLDSEKLSVLLFRDPYDYRSADAVFIETVKVCVLL